MGFENAMKTSGDDCFHLITSDSLPMPYVLCTIVLSIIVHYGGITNALLLYGSIRATVKYNSTQKLFLVLFVGDLWNAALPIQMYIVNLEPNM